MPRVLKAPRPTSAEALLQLMWLGSPALPVGGFSYSEALESAVEAGLIGDAEQASDWLIDQLHLRLPRSDLPVVHRAFGAWRRNDLDTVGELNRWVTQTRETSELLQQTQQMGRSLVEWLKNRGSEDARVMSLAALPPRRPGRWPSHSPPRKPAQHPAKPCSASPSAGPRTWCRRR